MVVPCQSGEEAVGVECKCEICWMEAMDPMGLRAPRLDERNKCRLRAFIFF